MSYAASLLATYPSSYGPSTLLSDELVTRSSFDKLYPSSLPYMSSGRLLSDDLAFSQLNYDTTTTYRPPLYTLSNSTSVYPTANYSKTLLKPQRQTVPPNNSFASLNDITEYSDSLATASNTNTASSVARSIDGNYIDGPMNMFSNYPQNPNRMSDNILQQSVWNSPNTKQKVQSDTIKAKSTTTRSQPSIVIQKKSPAEELNDDLTPVQSPQTNKLQQNVTIAEMSKQTSSIDIQAWVNDTKKESPLDDKVAEQAWSVKMGQLHQAQIQREKEKAKLSRVLPIHPKRIENKSLTNKTKSITDTKSRDTTYQIPNDSYFDSLFDGDFFRKPSTNDYALNSSYQQPTIKQKTKLTTSSFNNSNTNLSKNPKYIPQRKTQRYEPPTTKRVPPTITTDSWRKEWPKRYHFDSMYPYYLHNEFTHRDFVHKDTDERFREALQKLRHDRAEQQNKDINEKTAKRLHYGDYVRHSTKDALMQNAVKPSPWSDFMDLKKGNIYSLSKEEKKQLYNQSKYYGERIRYRNFAIHYGAETTRSHLHSVPLLDDNQESQSDHATPHTQNRSKSVSRISKRPDSASTNRSHTKQTGTRGNRTNNQPSRNNRSDGEYENLSDYETNRKAKQQIKKKNVRYAKYDSSGRTTSGTEESDNEHDNYSQRNTRNKNREINDDLFTVREEKTMESIENARYKKR